VYIIVSKCYVNVKVSSTDSLWVIALVLGVINLLFNGLNWFRISLAWDIGIIDYLLPSFRLFGGIIPGLHKIRKGVSTLDWTNFAFGRFTYIQFVELLSGSNVKLSSIDISYKTLMYLSENLCSHFGNMMKAKNIGVNFYAAPSAEQCFRDMDDGGKGYISLEKIRRNLAKTGKFKDVEPDKFRFFFEYLDEYKRVHFSQFLDSTKSRAYRELLHIREPMNGQDDRGLFKFMMGLGMDKNAAVDLERMSSMVGEMVDDQDPKLLTLLDHPDNGFDEKNWEAIGLRLCRAIHNGDKSEVNWLIKVSKKCKDPLIHPFFVSDETGNCPAHYAIMSGSARTLKRIIDGYERKNSLLAKQNNDGTSALSLGLASDNKQIRYILDEFIL